MTFKGVGQVWGAAFGEAKLKPFFQEIEFKLGCEYEKVLTARGKRPSLQPEKFQFGVKVENTPSFTQ